MINFFGDFFGGDDDGDEDVEVEMVFYDEDGNEIVDEDDILGMFQCMMEPGSNVRNPAFGEPPLSAYLTEEGPPELEEDGLPSKEWLVDALAFYVDSGEALQAEILYHNKFESRLMANLWANGCLQRVGTAAGRLN